MLYAYMIDLSPSDNKMHNEYVIRATLIDIIIDSTIKKRSFLFIKQ